MCQGRYQPDSHLREISESTGQTEAARLSQPTAAPGLKPPRLQTNPSQQPGESAWETRQPAAAVSLASRNTVPGSQREDQAHVL